MLCGQYGVPFLWVILRYSKKPSNRAEENGGPWSERTIKGKPCVWNMSSIALVTCTASVFFKKITSPGVFVYYHAVGTASLAMLKAYSLVSIASWLSGGSTGSRLSASAEFIRKLLQVQ